MGLSEYNISKMSDSFIATFLSACLQAEKVPFMDICLGFVHASKKILRYMVELDMLTTEQMKVIDDSLAQAIEQTVKDVESQKLIKILSAISGEEEESGGSSEQE